MQFDVAQRRMRSCGAPLRFAYATLGGGYTTPVGTTVTLHANALSRALSAGPKRTAPTSG